MNECVDSIRRQRAESALKAFESALTIFEFIIRSDAKREAEREKVKYKKRLQRTWVRSWIEKRTTLGGGMLLRELAIEDPKAYTNALRMSVDLFNELLTMIEPRIKKSDTVMREALNPRLKLEVTLRYLATGDSFKSLSLLFRVPTSTISTFLPDVLQAIHEALSHCIKVSTYCYVSSSQM
jgi:hypothetical protein